MNLDTNIALGVRPPPIDFNAINQGNVLAQLAQLKNADNQNALAQYQLASAKRTDDSQTALNEAYKGAIDTATGKIDYPRLYANLASGGAAQHIPKVVEQQNAQRKNDTDEAVHRAKLVIDTTAAYRDMVGGINSKDEAIKWLQMQLNDPNMAGSPLTKQGIIEGAKKIPDDPAGLAQWKNQTALGMQKYIEFNKAHFIDRGNETQAVSSLTGLPLAGVPSYAKAPTPGDVMTDTRSRQQFAQTQGLAERKFKYEKDNPGMQYQEGPDGVGFGYNPKTNQMTPVMNAGGSNAMAPAARPSTNALAAPPPAQGPAPSAAPVAKPPAAAGVAGPMGITLPANAAAAVNAPGTPFVGKGEKMTEVQSNAAMFGGAMAQANNVMAELERKGVVKPNVGAEVLKGLAKLSPAFFGSGENAAITAESVIRQVTDSLGGITNDQARLAQAQMSFAVAYLRKTSGAAFGPSEILNTVQEFFPLIGEETPVINQKTKSRERAIEGMKISTNSEGKKYINSFQNPAPASNAVTHPSYPGFSIPSTK